MSMPEHSLAIETQETGAQTVGDILTVEMARTENILS